MRKRANKVLVLMIFVATLFTLTACGGDNDKYSCKHCGRGMEAYWSYHDGYVCYSCDKKYYK